MDYVPGDMSDDPEFAKLAKKQRIKRIVVKIIIAVIIAGLLIWLVPMSYFVEQDLTAEGHTDIKVSRTGIFTFSFTSKREGAPCHGRLNRTPGTRELQHFTECGAIVKPAP